MIEFAFEGDQEKTEQLFRAIIAVLGGERPDESQSLRDWFLQHQAGRLPNPFNP